MIKCTHCLVSNGFLLGFDSADWFDQFFGLHGLGSFVLSIYKILIIWEKIFLVSFQTDNVSVSFFSPKNIIIINIQRYNGGLAKTKRVELVPSRFGHLRKLNWKDVVLSMTKRGVVRLFKMRGRQGGLRGGGGADWDSKWRLSIDLCTKCNLIWEAREGAEFVPGAVEPPLLPLAMPLLKTIFIEVYLWPRLP